MYTLKMLQKTGTRAKSAYAQLARELVRTNTGMEPSVFCKVGRRRECLGANVTLEILRGQMNCRMLTQHHLRFASISTLVARESFVRFLVLLVKNSSGKVHIAYSAEPWSVHGRLVRNAQVPALKNFTAHTALELGLVLLHGIMRCRGRLKCEVGMSWQPLIIIAFLGFSRRVVRSYLPHDRVAQVIFGDSQPTSRLVCVRNVAFLAF